MDVPEMDLVARAQNRDSAAFGRLYERYMEQIYRYLYYRVSDRDEAEDLTETVFVKAWEALPRFRPRGATFRAWLYRIAHNLVANFHRDRSRKKEISLDNLPGQALPQRDPHPESHAVHKQEVEDLLETIRDLADNRQELLILKFIDQLSNAEIGQIMRKSEGAIKSLYHRTLLELREKMDLD